MRDPRHVSWSFPPLFLAVWMVLQAAPAVVILGADDPRAQPDPSDAERVFVSGVPDTFDRVREAIAAAKQTSGRDYRVIVVRSAGDTKDAPTQLLESVVERWQREAEEGGSGAAAFDPARDVTIVVDVEGKQIAMRAPWGLEVASGLDPGTIKTELLDKVFVPRVLDGKYEAGLVDLVAATEQWVKSRADRAKARADAARVFRTRTLPLGLASLAGLGLVTGVLLQRMRHERRIAEARKKLAAFKSEVVALSDLLDSQQERHRMLPHADADFKTPMQGLTRSTYDNVQGAIRRYRERWLSLMEIWEKAEQMIGKETFLGTAAADETIRLLDAAEARPPLADVAGECRAPLDALEQAHERARELASALDAAIAAAGGRLETLAKRGRSAAVFQPVMADVARGLAVARQDLEADPVAARGRLEERAAALDRAVVRVDELETVDDRRIKAAAEIEALAQKVRSRRAEGWLLAEPGANPDDCLASGRHEVALCAQLLDAGEMDGARSHLERSERAASEARALVESIEAAKAKASDLLPSCAARMEVLAARRDHAERSNAAIAATFADAAWADIADNVRRADEGLDRVRSLLVEAEAAVDASRQHFFRAVAVLEETVRQEDWIEGLYAAIDDRRTELDGLLATLPKRLETVRHRLDRLNEALEAQRTDRVRANERAREAGRLLEAARSGLRLKRPDVRRVGEVLDGADTAAARGEELAAEDERLARQAFQELEETDALVRRVAAWYGEGVSPDVGPALAALESAKSLLTRQRYEESLTASAEAARIAREAYSAATAEADRRRRQRQAQIRQRQLEESFARTSRGFGPWVIQLPGGVFSGPDPWRTTRGPTISPPPSRAAESGWSHRTAQSGW